MGVAVSWLRIAAWFGVLSMLFPLGTIAQGTQSTAPQKKKSPIDTLVDRITAREHKEVQIIRKYRPIIETYIQDVRQDKHLGAIPVKDHYFIGVADLGKGVVLHSMDKNEEGVRKHLKPLEAIAQAVTPTPMYVPEGFLEMIYIDPTGFDRRHYIFEYVHREFLGDVRCLVFDIMPAPNSGNERFKGRMWVEDQDYTIVRFSGVFEPVVRQFGFNLHFDSWRENAGPGLWLPAYIYNGEKDLSELTIGHVNERSQTRLWGYEPRKALLQQEFSEMKVESPNVEDQEDTSHDATPLEQQRTWEHQGEQRVLEKLQRARLVSTEGEVDKMLDTVLNNIEVTNNLDIQPEIKCRVLLISTLESSSIGHTILISRGLVDSLPDEASLAAILSHEMAHVLLGRSAVPTWAFADELMFPDQNSLRMFSFYMNEGDEDAANQKALELLQNSPYKDHLASAGLFLRQLQADSKSLPGLISAHLRNPSFLNSPLIKLAPPLEPSNLEQIPALPLGSRIKLDPWNASIVLLKYKAVPLESLGEKIPLGLTPFYPTLTRKVDVQSPDSPAQ
jgi:hypothetical protein